MQTYKYYLPTGERLGIFYESGIVTVIPCSKKDQFSNKEAKFLYKDMISKDIILNYKQFEIVIGSQKEFLEWCNNHYKRMFYMFTPVKGKIVRIEKQKIVEMNSYEITKTTYLI